MEEQERILLELLVLVNGLERKCKTLHAKTAVPPIVYEKIDHLRSEIARWGTECVVIDREGKSDD